MRVENREKPTSRVNGRLRFGRRRNPLCLSRIQTAGSLGQRSAARSSAAHGSRSTARWSAGLLLSAACLVSVSCTHAWRNPFRSSGPPAPEVLVPGMSLEQVIAAVNQNALKIQSYQTNNASISVPGMPGVPRLSGNIAVQRPRRLRLQASSLLGPEIDLGSNDELFWLWVRRNEQPGVYFARHDQFAGSAAQRMLPIEPEWLLDAMGFTQLTPGDFHEGPIPLGDGTLEVRSVVNTSMGQVTKTTVLDGTRAWVLKQHVYDSQGSLLASAIARSHRFYPEAGVSLPQQIDIQMPAAQLSLSIDVGAVQLNQPAANPQVWQLPVIAGHPPVDLGAAAQATAATFGQQLSGPDGSAPWIGSGFGAPPNALMSPPPNTVPAAPVISAPVAPAIAPAPAANIQRLPPGGIASPDAGQRPF